MRINTVLIKTKWFYNTKMASFYSSSYSIQSQSLIRNYSAKQKNDQDCSKNFETVFSFPFVKHIATLNRIKVYHIIGAALAVPGCGLMETLGVLPEYSFLAASYIGVTGGILLSLASLPFNNTIGFLYISEDDRFIKVSAVDFWGRRKDRVIPVDAWTPLLDMKPKTLDTIYLSPRLADGTKYKLFVKYGNVLNSTKMGEVLE